MEVVVEISPRAGDRVDASVLVKGPGESKYPFPLSITGTLQAIWQIQDDDLKDALEGLVREMFSSGILGTASAPPERGYWFDSYNSESTVKATLDRMRSLGQGPFLKDSSEIDQISKIYGGSILTEIERISGIFFQKTSMRLVTALDYSFVRAEAQTDLGTAPKDNAGFLYRVCILSVIIDGFAVRTNKEHKNTKTLQALKNWLAETMGQEEARKATEPFMYVKCLRRQYPIHEHFEKDSNGQKIVLDVIQSAERYYEFTKDLDYSAKWKKVTDSFKEGIQNMETFITRYDQKTLNPND